MLLARRPRGLRFLTLSLSSVLSGTCFRQRRPVDKSTNSPGECFRCSQNTSGPVNDRQPAIGDRASQETG